jgi:hypothetical protein
VYFTQVVSLKRGAVFRSASVCLLIQANHIYEFGSLSIGYSFRIKLKSYRWIALCF